MSSNLSFTVKFSYMGKSISIDNISQHTTTAADLLSAARSTFNVDDDIILRLIFKGKTIAQDTVIHDNNNTTATTNNDQLAFPTDIQIPKSNTIKVIIMGSTTTQSIQQLNSLRSDPLMRGFDEEDKKQSTAKKQPLSTYWGPQFHHQNSQYKLCKFQECSDASFGTRPTSSTPHAFAARHLLHQLATDPGIISILTSRKLIVGTLGEIDPIDDRLMKAKAQEGACLLGYNTNHGMRIDIKLRTDDLGAFRPYNELASTLIHELSHNWVGEHNILFWTNYGHMRIEYLYKHAMLMRGGLFVNGKRTAALAGVLDMIVPSSSSSNKNNGNNSSSNNNNSSSMIGISGNVSNVMDYIVQSVIQELAKEMAQHHLPVQLVVPAMLSFSKELLVETKERGDDATTVGHKLGGSKLNNDTANNGDVGKQLSARERALEAAERRAREQKEKE